MTITTRFSTCACGLTHTTAMCCYQKGVNSIRVQRSLPGVTRNTRERTQNYIATFKFTNISIWRLLASFVFNYWKIVTLFRRAVHKLLFPFWPAPFGKGFKLETLEQLSLARIFLPPSTSFNSWNSFKLCQILSQLTCFSLYFQMILTK